MYVEFCRTDLSRAEVRLMQDRHYLVAEALMKYTRECLDCGASGNGESLLNPYLTKHLSSHAVCSGRSAWITIASDPMVLDNLDPHAVARDASRSASGGMSLPPPISTIIGVAQQLAEASIEDRRGLRELAAARLSGYSASDFQAAQ